ncbi:hypothetical protein [Allokutzneria sp. NRRL B-24872]|uniref:hypothetical protein n=1 Tax=Allokutzneria sp. NRRL B-24872 TaxID=1137961 RepID=UPI001177AB74|nr:hypothetical protein [Allokutzneria sp. NRRL B-24872]
MRTIRMAALAAVLALSGSACGGGGTSTNTSPTAPGGDTSASEPSKPAKPQTFADVPGEAMVFQASSRVGVNKAKAAVKVLQVEWATEHSSQMKPAPAGTKFLKVYFAVASANPAVEVEDFGPRDLNVRWAQSQAPSQGCPTGAYNPIFVTGYCHAGTENPHTDLVLLTKSWSMHSYATNYSPTAKLTPGTGYVTMGLYKIPDVVKGDLDVCASGMFKTGSEKETGWPCQKLDLPPRP